MIIEISRRFGIEAAVIGRVEEAEAAEICIDSPYGHYKYTNDLRNNSI